jgi:hypothetical protein
VASSLAEDNDIMIEEQLRERLRKVEALYLGAATVGDRRRAGRVGSRGSMAQSKT